MSLMVMVGALTERGNENREGLNPPRPSATPPERGAFFYPLLGGAVGPQEPTPAFGHPSERGDEENKNYLGGVPRTRPPRPSPPRRRDHEAESPPRSAPLTIPSLEGCGACERRGGFRREGGGHPSRNPPRPCGPPLRGGDKKCHLG